MEKGGAKPGNKAAAAFVHAYTAAGAVLAFVGFRAVVARDYRLAFEMMLIATLVDATDGTLARLARVRDSLPSVDGAKIDDIVDYITFVFLPVFLLDFAGGLPHRLALPVAAIVLLTSAYGFAAADAKSADHFFIGFPSYWNIVVFYLMTLGIPSSVNAVVLVVLSGLIFVRTGYVYPSRMPVLRRSTLVFATLWCAAVAWIIWQWPSAPRALAIASLAFPVYYVVLSVVLHLRRHQAVGA